jgi:hypothetical protein
MNAACHVRRNQWGQYLCLYNALRYRYSVKHHALFHGKILQLALAALITDRATRMVDQQKFHRRLREIAERVNIFMPSPTGVAQAGIGFGASTSTRHIRHCRDVTVVSRYVGTISMVAQ